MGGNATHPTSFTVREHKLAQLKELLDYCRMVEEESMGVEHAVWKGKEITISWNLTFEITIMRFLPCAEVIADDGTEIDDHHMLAGKVQAVLGYADIPFSQLKMRDWIPELRQS
jgi:hypothetical protein